MSKLRSFWNFVGRHKYFVAIVLFVVIVGFVDSNSFYNLYLQKQEIHRLQAEIQTYKDKYEKDTRTLKQLDANPSAIKKIARERYFMKRPNEDIYIIQK